MPRKIILGLGIIAIITFFLAYFMFVVPPPIFPNETLLKKGPIQADWSVKIDDMTITGSAIWANFAYYPDESIKLYHSVHLGAFLYSEEGLNWVDDQGGLQEKALTLENLTVRWQYEGKLAPTSEPNGSSTFKFIFDKYYLKAVFTIPHADDNNYKYDSLDEAWEAGELHLTIIEW